MGIQAPKKTIRFLATIKGSTLLATVIWPVLLPISLAVRVATADMTYFSIVCRGTSGKVSEPPRCYLTDPSPQDPAVRVWIGTGLHVTGALPSGIELTAGAVRGMRGVNLVYQIPPDENPKSARTRALDTAYGAYTQLAARGQQNPVPFARLNCQSVPSSAFFNPQIPAVGARGQNPSCEIKVHVGPKETP